VRAGRVQHLPRRVANGRKIQGQEGEGPAGFPEQESRFEQSTEVKKQVGD